LIQKCAFADSFVSRHRTNFDFFNSLLDVFGHQFGRKVLVDAATIAQSDTILGWYRKLRPKFAPQILRSV
jgi:hypothetical protein